MTFNEWVIYHDEHAKKHSPADVYHEEEGNIIYDKDNGFIRWSYVPSDNAIYLTEITGNAKFWEQRYIWIAKTLGVKKVVAFSSMENPKILERLFKAKAVSQEKGVWRFERMV